MSLVLDLHQAGADWRAIIDALAAAELDGDPVPDYTTTDEVYDKASEDINLSPYDDALEDLVFLLEGGDIEQDQYDEAWLVIHG